MLASLQLATWAALVAMAGLGGMACVLAWLE